MMLKPLFIVPLALIAFAGPAFGQVIEIDSSGQAQTYDQPTLFTATEATAIKRPSAPVAQSNATPITLLADAARNHGLQAGLLEAVAWQESRGRMSAVSVKGALGVMQLMPATAAELGVKPLDLADNIRGGALYLRRQLDR
ncbi:MAG: lytic transglycosylase domain-containing protein, partial [Pseudomonadota bacterium]|nr:lytic transglycosylase domain-containing protein [Pseudomonadota bacterium]